MNLINWNIVNSLKEKKNEHFYNNDINKEIYNFVIETWYTNNILIKIFYGIHFKYINIQNV